MKIGLIGCGRIAQVRHAPEYAENPRCTLAAFYDLDEEKARALAAQYGGRVYASVDALLDSGVDAVSVLVANDAHAQICIEALKKGIHVLCEKPMATTLEACEAMAAAAQQAGRKLVIGHNQRLTRTHQKARELIARGEIGQVLSFRTTFAHAGPERWTGRKDTWFFTKQTAALGALGDLGIHKIDLIHFLLGEPIVQVFAKLYTADKKDMEGLPIEVEDNALCTVETASGVFGQVQVGWTNYGPEENATVIYGSKGVLRCYADPVKSLILDRKDGKRQGYTLDTIASNAGQMMGERQNTGVVNSFIESILTGQPSFCDAQDALQAMRVVFAAQRSAQVQREIRAQPKDKQDC